MNSKRKQVDPIPNQFASYEEAAEFWSTHDTTDYLDVLRPVDVEVEFRGRHFEIEVDEDVAHVLQERAHALGTTPSRLASDLLRQQIAPAA
jgi:hypothetical protein